MNFFPRPTIKTFGAALLSAAMISSATLTPAAAQGGVNIVRDAEIENLLRDYSMPIFKAAGFQTDFVNIHLVNSDDFNAFVANGRRMFINTGTLKQAKTPNEVIGVIAHEAGHIEGGHLARIRQAAAGARAIAIFSQLLGGAALVAGAASGSSSTAQGGVGILQGGNSAAQRTLLAHQRNEEIAADRSAIKFLEETGQSGRGMLRTFATLQRELPIASRFIDPYALTHPLPRERIALVEALVEKSKYKDRQDSAEMMERHALMQAKLTAFTEHPKLVDRLYPKKDTSLAADYARAIVGYRYGNVKLAQKSIDDLIKRSPNYPYFWELKGQAYLESGKPYEAIAPLRKALTLAPGEPLIQSLLGHALVATEDPKYTGEAIRVLSEAVAKDQSIGIAHRQLAIAYSRQGQDAEATLATANGLFYLGDIKGAKIQAARAAQKFKRGSRGWLQADDILSYEQPKL